MRSLPPRVMTGPATVLVSRRETFNAAHQLRNPLLSDDENRRMFGKCVNLHGHNYALDVAVAGKIDDSSGYVLDLKRLSDIIHQQIIQHVDHRNLNTDRKPRSDLLGKAAARASRRIAAVSPGVGDRQELGRGR
jgi:6-pyruvoyl tetrahydropterin synthase/QueD family protein